MRDESRCENVEAGANLEGDFDRVTRRQAKAGEYLARVKGPQEEETRTRGKKYLKAIQTMRVVTRLPFSPAE